MSQPLYPQKRTLVPIERDAGYAPEQIWRFWEKNLFTLPGFNPQTVKPVA